MDTVQGPNKMKTTYKRYSKTLYIDLAVEGDPIPTDIAIDTPCIVFIDCKEDVSEIYQRLYWEDVMDLVAEGIIKGFLHKDQILVVGLQIDQIFEGKPVFKVITRS